MITTIREVANTALRNTNALCGFFDTPTHFAKVIRVPSSTADPLITAEAITFYYTFYFFYAFLDALPAKGLRFWNDGETDTAVTATGTAKAMLIDIAAAVKVETILRLIVLPL